VARGSSGQHMRVPSEPAPEGPQHADHGRLRHDVELLIEATEEVAREAHTSSWKLVFRFFLMVLAVVTLYALAPRLLDVWSELPRLREVHWWWFLVMFVLEAGSLVCLWWLIRIALPNVSWFVAGTAQLAGNAISKIVPGGQPVGAAIQFRMLSVSGVDTIAAVSALGATGLMVTWVIFALPALTLVVGFLGSPVPQGMVHVAWGGAIVFVLMFVAGVGITRSDRLLTTLGPWIERANHWVMGRLGRQGGITTAGLQAQRAEMVQTLGGRFRYALLAAVGNRLLDYGVLVAALLAIGGEPRLSLVLLAYAVSAILTMIPITPGGLGFTEAGLTAMLTLAGVPSQQALLATLAYRLYSYWLPLPAGLVAYIAFRRRYGSPPDQAERDARHSTIGKSEEPSSG
jgi:uncharacterized protein (TIRG00374 family)